MRALCRLLCLGVAAGSVCHISDTDPQYEEYAADTSKQVPGWQVVDLDLPPKERWGAIVAPHAKEIQEMINAFKESLGSTVDELLTVLEKLFGGIVGRLLNVLPKEYSEELKGIQEATGISAIELFVYNIMYELSGACTSVVAQDKDGHIIHGRNLDFGPANLAEKLRPLLMHVRFVKGGRTLFNSTSYAGYVGCLTCMKEGAFSVTVDTRLWHGVPGELVKWLSGLDRSGHFLTFMTRDAMQEDSTYEEAVHRINSTKLLGPAYIIVGGAQAGEGSIVTRDSKQSLHYWSLADEVATKDTPYILETNYDHWDGKSHDRRENGNACMDQIVAQDSIDFGGVFQVLSSKPNRNDGTTYTTLMSSHNGRMESYIQHCCDDGTIAQV